MILWYYRYQRKGVIGGIKQSFANSFLPSSNPPSLHGSCIALVIRITRIIYITTTIWVLLRTVYPKKYAHAFCFAVLCCGYALTDFPISIRLTSLALWQSYDCPSASKATLMNMDKYFMWINYERLYNHNKATKNRVHISWDILYY